MAEDPSYDLHFYARYLLAQFREKQAFPKLIRLLKKTEHILQGLAIIPPEVGYGFMIQQEPACQPEHLKISGHFLFQAPG